MINDLKKSKILFCSNQNKKIFLDENSNNFIEFDFKTFFNNFLNLNILDEDLIFFLLNKELYNSCETFKIFDNEKLAQRKIYIKEFLNFYSKLRARGENINFIDKIEFTDSNSNFSREDFKKLLNCFLKIKKKLNFIDYYDFLEIILKKIQKEKNEFLQQVFSFFKKNHKEKNKNFFFDFNKFSNLEIELILEILNFLNHIQEKFVIFYNKITDNNFFNFEISRIEYFNKLIEKKNLKKDFEKHLETIETKEGSANKNSINFINQILKQDFLEFGIDLKKFALKKDYYKTINKNSIEESFSYFNCSNELSQFGKIYEIISKNPNKKITLICPNNQKCRQLNFWLEQKNISTNLIFNENLLNFKDFRKITNLFKILNSTDSDIAIFESLQNIFNNDAKLSKILKKLKNNFYSKLKDFIFIKNSNSQPQILDIELLTFLNEKIEPEIYEKLKSFILKIEKASKEKNNFSKFKKIISEFEFIKTALETKNKKLIYFLKIFYSKIETLNKIGLNLENDFLEFLNFNLNFLSKNHQINISTYENFSKLYSNKNPQKLDILILPFLNQRTFPKNFSRNSFDKYFNQNANNFYKDQLSSLLNILDYKTNSIFFLNIEQSTQNNSSTQNTTNLEKSIFLHSLNTPEQYYNKEIKTTNSQLNSNSQTSNQETPKPNNLGKFFKLEKSNLNQIENKTVYLSATKIQNYLNCPKKYEYNYLLGLPSPYRFYFSFGTSVHDTLEILIKNYIYEQNIQDPNILFTKFISILTQKWISKGYDSKNQEKLYFEKAIKLSKNLIKKELLRKQQGFKLFKAEEKINYNIEHLGIKILGFVDRVDKIKEDLVILDYKTSKSKKSTSDLKKDVQLFLYKYYYKIIKKYNVKSVGLWFLIFDEIVEIDLKDIDDNTILENIDTVAKGIRNKNFKANKTKLCDYCEYKNICKDYWEI